jgi:hypothetical protein
MRHQNSVLHDVLKRIPWDLFDQLVEQHGSDYRSRRLSTKDQLVALLYGQFSGAASLREIEAGLSSHRARLYHLGSRPVKRSTLADANEHRSSAVFAELFATMAGRVHRGLRRAIGEAVYLIDSTGIPLNNHSVDWARYSAEVCGAKLHVIYDPDADQPIYAAITPSRRNDISAGQEMPIEAGATYVFDLGYYDYGWWAAMADKGCRIVTRFKRNTPLAVVEERPLPEGSAILSDRIGHLPERQSHNRRNPFQDPVREVRVMTDTGKILRILTNDIDASAQEIADLYKRRWAIELFFRWVKQTLKIRHFLGASQNAVRIQIIVALIAFLLLRLAQAAQNTVKSPLAFVRLVRANLMQRRRIDHLIDPEPPTQDPRQLAILWS